MQNKNENLDDKATLEWLHSQKHSTQSSYKAYWRHFLEYAKMNGDQILADRKTDKEHKWERLVLAFKQWMQDEKHQSQNSAATATMAVRGFFAYNYLPLQYRAGERKKLKERVRKTEDYRFSIDDLKKMVDVGDLPEKYIITAGKSFGLRAGDFMRLTRGDIEPYLNNSETPIGIGQYNTEKESVCANPFIDSDALPIIKAMIQNMTRQGRTKPTDKMLEFKDSISISRTLERLADKAGIPYGTKNVRFHCLRKFLIDHLSSFMSESKWKQIVGKQIDEKAYVSLDSLREDYKRAMSETTFTKTSNGEDVKLLAQKEALKMMARFNGMSEEQMKVVFRQKSIVLGRDLNLKDEVEALEEETTKTNKPKTKGCADGKHCQRIIEESELIALLDEGFKFIATLPSGKIVVSND